MSLTTAFSDPKTRVLLLVGFAGFVLIGGVQAMYGPAFAVFQDRFSISTTDVGFVVSLHFVGSLVSILSSGFVIGRLGYRLTLSLSILLMAVGGLGLAFSPFWWLILVFALLVGFGFGFVDAGMNMLFGRSFEANSAPALNLLNAMFGVGAVLGPLLVAVFLPRASWAFGVFAGVCLLVFFFALRLPNPEVKEISKENVSIPWGRFVGFLVIFFLYVMAEVGAASWETSHLAPYYGEKQGALFTSLYWAALTVGRFVATPVSAFLKARTLVLFSAVLALVAAVLTHSVALAPFAYMLMGFAFAPFFPTGLSWLQKTFPERAEQLTPFVMASANLGAVVASPAIGLAVASSTRDAVPTVMSVVTALLLGATLLLWLRASD